MSTNASSPDKDTDRTACQLARAECHDAHLLGVTPNGDTHFWPIYHQATLIVRDGTVGTFELPVAVDGQRLDTLDEWVEHHDWTALPGYTDDSLVDDLDALLEGQQ